MKRSAIVVAAFAGLLMGCGVETFAPPTGGLGRFIVRGTVTNLVGALMSNVTVQVQPLNGGTAIRTMVTDATGTYRTFGLAAGNYRVVVVMGDSSIISAVGIDRPPGLREPVVVGQTDSVIIPALAYDPGRIISGSLTYTYQDTTSLVSVALRGVKVRLRRRTATAPAPGVFAQVDSIRTSATGAFRFAVRPRASPGDVFQIQFDTTETAVFPNGLRAAIDSAFATRPDTFLATVNLVDTVRVTASATTNATSTVSGSLTFRAPYTIRARIFKDRNGDGIYRAVATDPDTVVSGVRIWLRRFGSTTNLGSGTVTSGTGTTLVGNTSFTTLRNAPNWTLHVIRWYLPTGCTIAAGLATLTAEGDVAVTPEFGPLSSTLAAVPIPAGNNIPLTCP